MSQILLQALQGHTMAVRGPDAAREERSLGPRGWYTMFTAALELKVLKIAGALPPEPTPPGHPAGAETGIGWSTPGTGGSTLWGSEPDRESKILELSCRRNEEGSHLATCWNPVLLGAGKQAQYNKEQAPPA